MHEVGGAGGEGVAHPDVALVVEGVGVVVLVGQEGDRLLVKHGPQVPLNGEKIPVG